MQQYLANLAAAVFREARWLTRERLLIYGSCLAFFSLGMLAVDLALHTMPGLTNASGEHFGRDFVQFWTSAQLAAAGEPAAAYVLGAPDHLTDQAISYPPLVMMLCRPLAGLSYAPAVLVWGGLGLILFAFTLSRFIGWEMAVFASVGTPGAYLNLFLQQNGYFTAVLLGVGLILIERRPAVAGFLLGMLCYKPQFAILVPPALIAAGHWRVLGTAALTALALTAASAILFGPETWIAFFERSLLQRRWMEAAAPAWAWMPTVFTMMRLIGAASSVAYACQVVSAIFAAVAIAVLWRQRCALAIKASGLLIASFLATPYAWDYDAVLLTFAAAWLGIEGVKTSFRPWEKMTILALLMLPALSVVPVKLFDFQTGPILLWLCLAVVIRRASGWRFTLPVPAIRRPSPEPVA